MDVRVIVGWQYEATDHCQSCAEKRFPVARVSDSGREIAGTDSEGNPVHPIYAGTEYDYQPACDDCGGPIDGVSVLTFEDPPVKHDYCLALNLVTQRPEGDDIVADVIAVMWGETRMTLTTWGFQTQEWVDMMNERLDISKPDAQAMSHCSIFKAWDNYAEILKHFRICHAEAKRKARKEAERQAGREKLPVVYRILQGEVIALFPTLPGSEIYTCTSYMHVGQHSAADAYELVYRSGPASPKEYADLHEELAGIYREYELVVYKRIHQWMHDERIAEVRRTRAQ